MAHIILPIAELSEWLTQQFATGLQLTQNSAICMPETGWAFVLCSSIPVEGREFFLKRQWRAGSNFV
jgi:hypothetical protein